MKKNETSLSPVVRENKTCAKWYRLCRYCSIVLLAVVAAACQTNPQGSFRIEGNIEGLPDGTILELIPSATHKEEKSIGSATLTGGQFEFTGNMEEPRLFQIAVAAENTYGAIPVMVEAAKITVTAKASRKEENGRISYQFTDTDIKGSKGHLDYLQKSVEPRAAMNQLFEDYHEKNKEILDIVSEARKTNDQEQLKTIYESDAWKTFAADEKNFFETVGSNIEKMVLENADTWWGPFLMLDQMSYLTKEQESWWEQLSDTAKNSYYGQLVKEELFPIGFKGQKAPDFTAPDRQKNSASLSALVAGKKYTLLDFWASWCAPCRKEIPNFKEAYKIYAGKGFEIVSISIDKNESDWIKALDKEQLPWPNFRDQGGIADTYKVKMIPATFLIDEEGVIIEENLRGEELLHKLELLFQ